jgi:Amt family ammonium transporter
LIAQVIGVAAVAVWTVVTSTIMFGVLKAVGILRMPAGADTVGIDVYEHGASVMPDLLPMPGEGGIAGSDSLTSPATGD